MVARIASGYFASEYYFNRAAYGEPENMRNKHAQCIRCM